MTCDLVALSIDAQDPGRLAEFWSDLLGWSRNGAVLVPDDDTRFRIRFVATQEPKTGPNQAHFDLTSTSLEDQRLTVARARRLGAQHLDVGQRPEEGHVVLADPEGNELCVVGPDNDFLADCGFLGAVSCDGLAQVGYFWSEALGWPLVWDQDQETAIRAPYGGPKITWGGPPLNPLTGPSRLRFEVLPDGDQESEVARLVSLGATPVGVHDGTVLLADPGGNEFRVLPGSGARPERPPIGS